MKIKLRRPSFRFDGYYCACVLALGFALSACGGASPGGGGAATNADAANSSASSAKPNAGASEGGALDSTKLDADIELLEKEAEKNPGDQETLTSLSQAYLRRANAYRDRQQLREALRDYQNALRHNPDNEEAQQRVAEISPQFESEATGENGEPAPLPITPGVSTGSGDERDASPASTPTPSSTVKKKKEKQ